MNKNIAIVILAAVVVVLLSLTFWSGDKAEEIETTKMGFGKCIRSIDTIAKIYNIKPVKIVHTNILKIVRLPTDDGSVLVTCSKPDRKRVIVTSYD